MSKRAVLYARVSYDDRKNKARNLEGQIEDGRAYCQERGYRIVAELAEDDRGASGYDWDLPMLGQALDMARAGELDVFVTRELDRFARNLAKQLVIESEFKRYGVVVEYILGEYPDTPEGNLNKNIKAVIAEYERLKIKERMTRGLRRVCKDGKVMLHGNKPPYGYRAEDRMLVIYEPEAQIVRLIFTWYVYGDETGKRLSMRAIAMRLTSMGVPTWADTHTDFVKKKRGHGEWSRSSVRQILSNEVYNGIWYYGKTNGRTGKKNPREHWVPVEVPSIISRELWEKAQERRERNKETAKRNTKYEYLVGRRVTCGHCGNKMVGRLMSQKYWYYYCPVHKGQRVEGECDNRYFNVAQVDKAVWSWVKELLLDPEALRRNLKVQQAKQEEANKPLHGRLAVIDDLLADNRRQLKKLLDLYLAEEFDKEMLTERKTRLEATVTALEKERAGLVTTLEATVLSDDQIMTIEDFARKVAEGLRTAEEDFEARRRIIDLLDVQVILAIEDGEKIAYVHCLVGEAELSIVRTTSKSLAWPKVWRSSRRGWLVSPEYTSRKGRGRFWSRMTNSTP